MRNGTEIDGRKGQKLLDSAKRLSTYEKKEMSEELG